MAPPKTRRVAVMGYTSVGKSTLCIQFIEGHFVDNYDPTIENTFNKVNGQEFGLELIDTAGQDEFSIFPNHYAMDIQGYILVYSITSAASFDAVQSIYEKIVDLGKVNVPIVLVGNKTDLQMERAVSTESGRKKAEQWNAVFIETTAKQHESVNEIFSKIILEIEKLDGNLSSEVLEYFENSKVPFTPTLIYTHELKRIT
ncbi:GTP-binding protein Rheb [Armadillidium vulgare]|nr:GTP-binding protein Rheb [Armadillidium vulgare]